jgi:hypothetical protein
VQKVKATVADAESHPRFLRIRARAPLQQVAEIDAKGLLSLCIDDGGSRFHRFLFPPLLFFACTQLASHSHPQVAADGLKQ